MDRDARGLARVIVVVGGGWAGCAAAVELAAAGCSVELHETAATIGGRARTVLRDGLPLDNGEHLILAAYAQTLGLAAKIRDAGAAPAWRNDPLAIAPLSRVQPNAITLRTRGLPGPLGLLTAIVGAEGLALGERLTMVGWFARQRRRGYRCASSATVADVLADVTPRVRDKLWYPLCLAALNTPPERASGQVFLNVLRETFGAGARATAMIVPRDGLANMVPAHASEWLVSRGHAVRISTRTKVASVADDGVLLNSGVRTERADAVVVAVGPHQLEGAFEAGVPERHPAIAAAIHAVARFDYEPIVTAYLGYSKPLALGRGLVRLDDAPGQWLLDRPDILERALPCTGRPDIRALVSVVLSAHGPHDAVDHRHLVAMIDAQLTRLAPGFSDLRWSQVIAEKRATYACVPQLARPACGRLAARVYLAGDYTYPAFPATLEAAVRSGVAAARALIRDQSAPR